MIFLSWSHERVTAAYAGECNFRQGIAKVSITLIKHYGQWQVSGFNVQPVNMSSAQRAILELDQSPEGCDLGYSPSRRTVGMTLVAKRSIVASTSRCGVRPPGLNQQTS